MQADLISRAYYKGYKQRRKHNNFEILYFYSRDIPARLFLSIPKFGTLMKNSWNVLERRASYITVASQKVFPSKIDVVT
jgi:hypothetical protein